MELAAVLVTWLGPCSKVGYKIPKSFQTEEWSTLLIVTVVCAAVSPADPSRSIHDVRLCPPGTARAAWSTRIRGRRTGHGFPLQTENELFSQYALRTESLPSLPLSLLSHALFPSAEHRSSWLPKQCVNNLFGWHLLQITLRLTPQPCLLFSSLAPCQPAAGSASSVLQPEQRNCSLQTPVSSEQRGDALCPGRAPAAPGAPHAAPREPAGAARSCVCSSWARQTFRVFPGSRGAPRAARPTGKPPARPNEQTRAFPGRRGGEAGSRLSLLLRN